MGALVGLAFGVGALLLWAAWARPQAVASSPRAAGWAARLVAEAGVARWSPSLLVTACAAVGLLGAVFGAGITGVPTIGLALGAVASYLPVAGLSARARRRRRRFAEAWPEAVDDLASAVRAGMSLPDAVAALAVRGPEALRPSFDAFALDYQASGRFGDCLDRLAVRLADPVGDRVLEGLRIAREVGGGELGRLLRNLSGYLREDLRIRAELEARQSWTVNGARVAVAAPWLVLVVMSAQPSVVERYRSAGGALVLAVGAGLCLLAYRLMVRIGRLPEERRILR